MEQTIIIRVDAKLKKELQKLADNDKRPLSNYIRFQLEKIVEQSNVKK